MIENPNSVILVVERLKKYPNFERDYRVFIEEFKVKFKKEQEERGEASPDFLLGILSGLIFVQQCALVFGAVEPKLQSVLVVSACGIAEMLLEALEPVIAK